MRHLAIALGLVMSPLLCTAQVPAVLGQCIVANITAGDRQDLARWVFLSMSAYPEVKLFSSASVEAPRRSSGAWMVVLTKQTATGRANGVRNRAHHRTVV